MKNSTSPTVHSSESAKADINESSEIAKPRLSMIQTDEHPDAGDGTGKGKPALDLIDFVRDAHNRVKLYAFSDQRTWIDRGTGHVACVQSRDQPDAWWIVVRLEFTEENVLESKILPDTIYQKQRGATIGWSESDVSNVALCFQEKAGCAEVWDKICQIQGKDTEVEIIDNPNNFVAVSEKLRASEASNLQLTTEIQEISGKYQISTEKLKIAQEQIHQLEIKVQEKQAPIAQLLAVLEETTQKVKEMANLENLLKSTEDEARKMKAEIKNMKKEAEKMAGENATLKDQNNSSVVKIRQMKQKVAELEAKKQKADNNETLVTELQTELEKCRHEAEEAVNARSHVFETLAGLLPQVTPSKPICPKRPLPKPQCEPEPVVVAPELRSRGSEKKKCYRANSVVSEAETARRYNLVKRRFSVPLRKFTTPETPEAKFYQYNDTKVYRDGFEYRFNCNLTRHPFYKVRMHCVRNGGQYPSCKGYIWTTGKWETDNRGKLYQRGIIRGGHSHDAQEQFFIQDDTAHAGGPMDNKKRQSQEPGSDSGPAKRKRGRPAGRRPHSDLAWPIPAYYKRQSQEFGSDSGPAKRKRGRPAKAANVDSDGRAVIIS